MRIESFQIYHYGPLRASEPIQLQTFNLFWGRNEDGKTLTLEALVKLLMGKHATKLEDYQRVEERPEGYVVVQLDNGASLRLGSEGSICELLSITRDLFINLFVVRNSDLVFKEKSRSDRGIYGKVTEVLTHSRLSRLERLKQLVLEKGRLTPGRELSNSRESGYVKHRYQKAQQWLGEIERLQTRARQEKWDTIVLQLARVRHRMHELQWQIDRLEKARLRTLYHQALQRIGSFQQLQKHLASLSAFTSEASQQWVRLESEIQQQQKRIETLEQGIRNLEVRLHQEEQRWKALRAEVAREELLRRQIEDQLLPEWKRLCEFAAQSARRPVMRFLLHSLLGGALAAVLLTLYFLLKNPSSFSLVGFLVSFLIFGGAVTAYWWYIIRSESKRQQQLQQIKNMGISLGFSAETAEAAVAQAYRFLDRLQMQHHQLSELESTVKAAQKNLQEKQTELHHCIQERHQYQQQLQSLKTALGITSLEEFNRRLQQKTNWEQQLRELQGELNQMLGTQASALPTQLQRWQEELGKLQPYKDQAGDTEFQPTLLQQLESEKESLEEKARQLSEVLRKHDEVCRQLEKAVGEVLEGEPVTCRTVFDFPVLRRRLEAFCQTVERQKWKAIKLLEVLDQVYEREQRHISELFGEKSRTLHYFRHFTEGRYTNVRYLPADHQIRVTRKDGVELRPEQLSGGAFDQLYFSIRLALAREVLKGRTGFFILDDPFLKADRERLERLLGMLLELSRSGWQILYFSAKDEIRDHLAVPIQQGEVVELAFPHPAPAR